MSTEITASFQSGVSGYTGTIDGTISSKGGGNGTRDFVGTTASITLNSKPAYESAALVRFASVALPAGAVVTGASVTLTFKDHDAQSALRGYYVLAAWNPGVAGWLLRDTGVSWALPGAKGPGTDRSVSIAFSDGSWAGRGNLKKTYVLDPAVVQSWVNTPTANLGIALYNATANQKLSFYTAESTPISNRPALTIEYRVPLPPDARLADAAILPDAPRLADAAIPPPDAFVAKPDAFVPPPDAFVPPPDAFVPPPAPDAYVPPPDAFVPPPDAFVPPPPPPDAYVPPPDAFVSPPPPPDAYVPPPDAFVPPPDAPVADAGPLDTFAPSVALTAPAASSRYRWSTNVTLAATASDDVGVVGVQFVVDGFDLGSEDTTAPYELTYNTPAADGTHTITARARDAAGHVATASALTITVDRYAAAAHPRVWMDAARLATLRARAAAADARWTALANRCNSYLGGTVRAPSATQCNDSCSGSTICCGYQGDTYYRAILEVALCYRIGSGMTPPAANTVAWAQKGAAILTQMAAFTNYSTDHGYGIRFFVPGLAVGYDWLHDYLTANEPALAATVVQRINAWVDWYGAQPASFNFREHPTSNYFAGYYAAKALGALATEGDNASAPTHWSQWLALHRTAVGTHAGIASYYTRFFDGGGWVQGWQYGPLSIRNMIEPSLAAWTAKGLDLVTDPQTPYRYAITNALHLMHFATPSLTMMDDRDELHSFNPADPGVCPSMAKVPVSSALTLTAMLRRWPLQTATGADAAPYFHSFARTVRSIYAPEVWQNMLFWDEAESETPYTSLPERSYNATNYVAMRSAWSTSATMATLRAVAYSDKDNQHEHPDGGSLLITRGNGGAVGAWKTDVPFLVSPNFLLRCYGTTAIQNAWETSLRDDLLTTNGARSTTNVFRNSTTAGQSMAIYQDATPAPRTQIQTFEDRNGYVRTRADHLEDLYPAAQGITEWSRDVVFVRPQTFVVYDRTTSSGITADAHLSWHFAPTPTLVTPPSPGAVRYDVVDSIAFKGAVTTLLPADATISTENELSSNKMFALRVRGPSTSGSLRWLTVFDTATSTDGVAIASRIQTMNANGARMAAADGTSTVVLFGLGAAGTTISGPVAYSEPAAPTTLVVTDLLPNTSYAVSVTSDGVTHSVRVESGASTFMTTAAGSLSVRIAADGSVTAAN